MRRVDNLTTSMCQFSCLLLLEPSGPVQTCTEYALPLPFTVSDLAFFIEASYTIKNPGNVFTAVWCTEYSVLFSYRIQFNPYPANVENMVNS